MDGKRNKRWHLWPLVIFISLGRPQRFRGHVSETSRRREQRPEGESIQETPPTRTNPPDSHGFDGDFPIVLVYIRP